MERNWNTSSSSGQASSGDSESACGQAVSLQRSEGTRDCGSGGGEGVWQESEKPRHWEQPKKRQEEGFSAGGAHGGDATSDSPADARRRGFGKGLQKDGGAKGVKVGANASRKNGGIKIPPLKTDRIHPKVMNMTMAQLRSELEQRGISLNGPKLALMKRLGEAMANEGRGGGGDMTDKQEDAKQSESGEGAIATAAALIAPGAVTKSASMAGGLPSSSAPSGPCVVPPTMSKRAQDAMGSDEDAKSVGLGTWQSSGPISTSQAGPSLALAHDIDGPRLSQLGAGHVAIDSLPVSPKAPRTKRSFIVPPARPPGVLHRDQQAPPPRPAMAGGPRPHPLPPNGDLGATRPVQPVSSGQPGPAGLAGPPGSACPIGSPGSGRTASLPPPHSTGPSSQPPPGDWAHHAGGGDWRAPVQPQIAQGGPEPPGEWPAHGPWPVRHHPPMALPSGAVTSSQPPDWRPPGAPPPGQCPPKGAPHGPSVPMSLPASSDWRHRGGNTGPPPLEWKQPQSQTLPQAPQGHVSSVGPPSQPPSGWGAPPQQPLVGRGQPAASWRMPSSLQPPAGYEARLRYGPEQPPLAQQAPSVPLVGGSSSGSSGGIGYEWKPSPQTADSDVGSAWGEAISSAPARALGGVVDSQAPPTEHMATRLAALAGDAAGGGVTAAGAKSPRGERRRHRQRRRESVGDRQTGSGEADDKSQRRKHWRHGRKRTQHRASSTPAPAQTPAAAMATGAELPPTSAPACAGGPFSTTQKIPTPQAAASQPTKVQPATSPPGVLPPALSKDAATAPTAHTSPAVKESSVSPATKAPNAARGETVSVSMAAAAAASTASGGLGCGGGVFFPPFPENSPTQRPQQAAKASDTKGSKTPAVRCATGVELAKSPTAKERAATSSSSYSEDDEADSPPSTELLSDRQAVLTPKRRQLDMDARAAAAAAAVAGPAKVAHTTVAAMAATAPATVTSSAKASTVTSAQVRRHEVGRQVLGCQEPIRQSGRREETGPPQPGSPQEADAAAGRQEGGTAAPTAATADSAAGAPSRPKSVGAASSARSQDSTAGGGDESSAEEPPSLKRQRRSIEQVVADGGGASRGGGDIASGGVSAVSRNSVREPMRRRRGGSRTSAEDAAAVTIVASTPTADAAAKDADNAVGAAATAADTTKVIAQANGDLEQISAAKVDEPLQIDVETRRRILGWWNRVSASAEASYSARPGGRYAGRALALKLERQMLERRHEFSGEVTRMRREVEDRTEKEIEELRTEFAQEEADDMARRDRRSWQLRDAAQAVSALGLSGRLAKAEAFSPSTPTEPWYASVLDLGDQMKKAVALVREAFAERGTRSPSPPQEVSARRRRVERDARIEEIRRQKEEELQTLKETEHFAHAEDPVLRRLEAEFFEERSRFVVSAARPLVVAEVAGETLTSSIDLEGVSRDIESLRHAPAGLREVHAGAVGLLAVFEAIADGGGASDELHDTRRCDSRDSPQAPRRSTWGGATAAGARVASGPSQSRSPPPCGGRSYGDFRGRHRREVSLSPPRSSGCGASSVADGWRRQVSRRVEPQPRSGQRSSAGCSTRGSDRGDLHGSNRGIGGGVAYRSDHYDRDRGDRGFGDRGDRGSGDRGGFGGDRDRRCDRGDGGLSQHAYPGTHRRLGDRPPSPPFPRRRAFSSSRSGSLHRRQPRGRGGPMSTYVHRLDNEPIRRGRSRSGPRPRVR
eukprot:TRINITY_DN8334_c0_g3_i1.p1 TRINITY_DN8334_c0_g3~~TRINITY_DN8334_c0_g3_i1.p1  ORF type:complete len:1702 (+),score=290.32 TRINITY_DN8334_c0_g3_i1:142-5247(+)